MNFFRPQRRDYITALITLLLIGGIWLAYKAVWMPMRIKQAIVAANHCEVSSDCQLARGRCDIDGVGFWIPVNKVQAYWVETLVTRAISLKTPMLCASQPPEVACVSGACRIVR